MRRSMQEIIPGVFLGPYSAAQKHCRSVLLDNGISFIICVRQVLPWSEWNFRVNAAFHVAG